MNTRYKIWKRIRDHAERAMRENYLKPHGGMNHACPNCKVWESAGNRITTVENSDGSDHRTCQTCSYEWDAIFTPAGFIQINT